MTSPEDTPMVPIVSVRPDAEVIKAIELRVGDLVFDVDGGTHKVTSVRVNANHAVSFKREGWPVREYRDRDATITVVRGDR